jgi:hypothetical protein
MTPSGLKFAFYEDDGCYGLPQHRGFSCRGEARLALLDDFTCIINENEREVIEMAVQQKIHIDEFENFINRPENSERRFELIDGEIVEKMPTII